MAAPILGFLSDTIWNGTLSLDRVSIGLLLTKLWRKNIDFPFAPSPPLPFSSNWEPYETTTTTATGTSKNNRFYEQNNNSARASRIFVHFFASTAQLRREHVKFTSERERQGDKFYYLCPNWSAFPSLQLQPKSRSFNCF